MRAKKSMSNDLKLIYSDSYESVELWYGDEFVGSTNYDEGGSAGIRIVELIAERLREILDCKLNKQEE